MTRPDPALAAFRLVTILCWLLVNVLAGVGAVTILFALMANATWQGIFNELGGLADHFLNASGPARTSFEALVTKVLLGAIALMSLVRLGALRAGLRGDPKDTPA